MRVASFNVENMFRRPIVLNGDDNAAAKKVLDEFSAFQSLLNHSVYTPADKKKIVDFLTDFGLAKSDEGPLVYLRRSRGQLVSRPAAGVVVTASGRDDWIGWLELKREAVSAAATRNTARVIGDLNADIIAVVEAEDRPTLMRFNHDVFGTMQAQKPNKAERWTYRHVMLIDGNDDRGIDVGLLAKDRFDIVGLRTHVDELASNGEPIFSRDCAEYLIDTPGGNQVLFLVNHFKSKGHGTQASSNAKRASQAKHVAEIYQQRRHEGHDNIIVLGDFNDTPDSAPLKSLIVNTDLRDVSTLGPGVFDDTGRTGTYGTGRDKIDYILCSPDLIKLATSAGIFRKGVWRGPRVTNPWKMYDTIESEGQSASDHAAIWAELSLT